MPLNNDFYSGLKLNKIEIVNTKASSAFFNVIRLKLYFKYNSSLLALTTYENKQFASIGFEMSTLS